MTQDAQQWNASCFTFTLQVDCPHCGTMVAVNGPVRQATCTGCQKNVPLTPEVWGSQVSAATEGSRILNNPYKVITTEPRQLACPQCEKGFPWDPQVLGQDTQIFCPHCGTGLSTFPAPDWLTEQFPFVDQVVGGEREDGQPAFAQTAEAAHQASKPIMLTCPNCSGALTVTAESERMLPCGFCGAEVFLPDPVWRRLHPVKTTHPWSLIYRFPGDQDQLWTKEDYEDHQRDVARRQQEEKNRHLEAIFAEQEREAKRRKDRTTTIAIVAGIIIFNLAIILITSAPHCKG